MGLDGSVWEKKKKEKKKEVKHGPITEVEEKKQRKAQYISEGKIKQNETKQNKNTMGIVVVSAANNTAMLAGVSGGTSDSGCPTFLSVSLA